MHSMKNKEHTDALRFVQHMSAIIESIRVLSESMNAVSIRCLNRRAYRCYVNIFIWNTIYTKENRTSESALDILPD